MKLSEPAREPFTADERNVIDVPFYYIDWRGMVSTPWFEYRERIQITRLVIEGG